MAQETYPTPAVPATVQRWARMARGFAPSAVLGSPTQGAYGRTVSGLNLTIGRGTTAVAEAWVRGFFHTLTAADWTVAVPPNAHATQTRIDRIVLRWDPVAESAALTHLQGTPAAFPIAAAVTQDESGTWDLPLWRFTVPANNGSPLTGFIDDRAFYAPVAVVIPSTPKTPTIGGGYADTAGTATSPYQLNAGQHLQVGAAAEIPDPGVPYTLQLAYSFGGFHWATWNPGGVAAVVRAELRMYRPDGTYTVIASGNMPTNNSTAVVISKVWQTVTGTTLDLPTYSGGTITGPVSLQFWQVNTNATGKTSSYMNVSNPSLTWQQWPV